MGTPGEALRWVGWPLETVRRALEGSGRAVVCRHTGPGPRAPGAELVVAVQDAGPPAPVVLWSAWFEGIPAQAWAEGGGDAA